MLRRTSRIVALLAACLAVLSLSAAPTMAGEDYTPPTPTSQDVAPTNLEQEPDPAGLPRTGSSSTEPLVRTGAVLIAAGAVLVYAVRRRQQVTTST